MMEQLMKMSREETAKYQKYKCGRLKKYRAISCLGLAVVIVLLNAMAFLGNQNIDKKFLAIMTVVSIALLIAQYFVIERNLKGLKSENAPYEYAFVKAVMDQKQKIRRENGEEVTYKIRSGNGSSFSDGKKIVVVYIPEGKRVYVETIEDWNKISCLEL